MLKLDISLVMSIYPRSYLSFGTSLPQSDMGVMHAETCIHFHTWNFDIACRLVLVLGVGSVLWISPWMATQIGDFI